MPLIGRFSAVEPLLTGRLSNVEPLLTGRLSTPPSGSPYTGDYEVTPKVSAQTLKTAGLTMSMDLTVKAVPYHETSNPSDGLTVHIA